MGWLMVVFYGLIAAVGAAFSLFLLIAFLVSIYRKDEDTIKATGILLAACVVAFLAGTFMASP